MARPNHCLDEVEAGKRINACNAEQAAQVEPAAWIAVVLIVAIAAIVLLANRCAAVPA